jgi:hypothetical protein
MKYLYNPNKKNTAAHIWDDGDTYCKMLSTGGIKQRGKRVFDDPQDKRICNMCQNVWKRIHEYSYNKNGG